MSKSTSALANTLRTSAVWRPIDTVAISFSESGALEGSKHGPAGPVRVYTEDERREYEQTLRSEGGLE